MLAETTDRIRPIIEPVLEERSCFLVELILRGREPNQVLELYVDGDAGVTSDTCAEISSAMRDLLKGVPGLSEDATLVVSSPGVDRPLRYPRQYSKHVGRSLTVTLKGGEGPRRLKGALVQAGPAFIELQPPGGGESRRILFEEILEARVETRW